jgi:hypothetical protein
VIIALGSENDRHGDLYFLWIAARRETTAMVRDTISLGTQTVKRGRLFTGNSTG